MPAKINQGDATEFECHRFVTEASTIRLQPGEWPEAIETTIGNGQPFLLHTLKCTPLGIASAIYEQANGCVTLEITND